MLSNRVPYATFLCLDGGLYEVEGLSLYEVEGPSLYEVEGPPLYDVGVGRSGDMVLRRVRIDG